MKIGAIGILILAVATIVTPAFGAQAAAGAGVPKYNPATEGVFKGTVDEVRDRQCAMSGGIGTHIVLKLADGTTIEVHVAPAKFAKEYELVFNKGDQVEVTGSKVNFEGVATIFAREVKRGNDDFMFRDKEGNPVW